MPQSSWTWKKHSAPGPRRKSTFTKDRFEMVGGTARVAIRITDVGGGSHGRSIENQYYFLQQDFDAQPPQTIETHAIGRDKWQAWRAQVAAQKAVIIIDTCESGAFGNAWRRA